MSEDRKHRIGEQEEMGGVSFFSLIGWGNIYFLLGKLTSIKEIVSLTSSSGHFYIVFILATVVHLFSIFNKGKGRCNTLINFEKIQM
jgi:hypothetical protein